MAQGFIISNGMLSGRSRELVQSAILVISNGDCPFRYQTAEKVLHNAVRKTAWKL